MYNPYFAWPIPRSGHYIEECLDLLQASGDVEVYCNPSGEEMQKRYIFSLCGLRAKQFAYVRKIDPEGTEKFRTHQYATVAKSVDERVGTAIGV